MNNDLISREDCPMRHENGNCLPAGGFCTAVNDPICEALHNAYRAGKDAGLEIVTTDLMERNERYMQEQLEILREMCKKITVPAVEAEPVRHGRWEEWYKGSFNPYACSVWGSCSSGRTNYCPNCGAEM